MSGSTQMLLNGLLRVEAGKSHAIHMVWSVKERTVLFEITSHCTEMSEEKHPSSLEEYEERSVSCLLCFWCFAVVNQAVTFSLYI